MSRTTVNSPTARNPAPLFVLLACSQLAAAAPTGSLQSLDAIRVVAERTLMAQFPHEEVQVIQDNLDRRLRLPACKQALHGRIPTHTTISRQATVMISCDAPRWSIYTQLALRSRINALVAKRTLPRGTQLSDADVTIEREWRDGPPGDYLREGEDLTALQLRRSVSAGSVLTSSDLEAAVLVRRGQSVTLLSEMPGVLVRSDAIALADGRQGGPVAVRSISSQRVVDGVVAGPGLVRAGAGY
ncbi:MAG: flagellar basal body P-ring formation chaperone FlgA [Steroidobacteraceae bacterium]